MAASASITHEALKTEARVYSVRQTPAGPLFLLWVPLSLRVQPPAPLVSRVARQRQRGSLSDTRSRRADTDGILKTGFFWVALVPGLVPSPRVAGALRTCLIRIGPSGLVLGLGGIWAGPPALGSLARGGTLLQAPCPSERKESPRNWRGRM